MRYRLIRSISGRGLRPESFSNELRGIHLDREGRLRAVGDNAVKSFDPDGRFLRQWPTQSPGICLTTLEDGRTVVGGEGRVDTYAADGRHVDKWQDLERLGRVTALAFWEGHMLLADASRRCIRVYDRDRRFVRDIGTDNNTRGFLTPNAHLEFAVDSEGVIHACNPGKYRIERYTLAGTRLGHFGRFGQRDPAHFPGCCNPTNMTLLSDGRVVVTEKAPPRMKVFDAAGNMLALVGPETFDANCKNMDVAADAEGRIYVVDTVKQCVQVFACEDCPAATRPATDTKGGTAS